MTDMTHFFDNLSLLVPSLKQHALMKVAETLIRPDLEMHFNITSLLYGNPLERLSDKIKQLPVPDSFKSDIRDVVLCLYLKSQHLPRAHALPPSALKFSVRGDLDVQRTFDGYMDDILRGPRPPRTYLFQFLRDACQCQQERSIHLTLCELLKWHRSNLEPSLRHAEYVVYVGRIDQNDWYYSIRYEIEDVDDPAKWLSFAHMCNINMKLTNISFEENALRVLTLVDTYFGNTPLLLWSEMTTLQKLEHAEEIFKVALEQLDTRSVIQTMRYVNSARRINLIKRNLVSFILCFSVHPYYRRFLPDLQLVAEDLQLVQEESELGVFEKVRESLESTGDYTNISDSLIHLWHYVSTRSYSLGDHVFRNIRTFLYDEDYGWTLQYEDDAEEHIFMLCAVFPFIL